MRVSCHLGRTLVGGAVPIAGIVEPPARLLLRIGVTPDMVTVVGALGSSPRA